MILQENLEKEDQILVSLAGLKQVCVLLWYCVCVPQFSPVPALGRTTLQCIGPSKSRCPLSPISAQAEFLLRLRLSRSLLLRALSHWFVVLHSSITCPLLPLPTRPIAFAPHLNISFDHLSTNSWMLLEAQTVITTFKWALKNPISLTLAGLSRMQYQWKGTCSYLNRQWEWNLPSWETVPVSEHDQTLINHY